MLIKYAEKITHKYRLSFLRSDVDNTCWTHINYLDGKGSVLIRTKELSPC